MEFQKVSSNPKALLEINSTWLDERLIGVGISITGLIFHSEPDYKVFMQSEGISLSYDPGSLTDCLKSEVEKHGQSVEDSLKDIALAGMTTAIEAVDSSIRRNPKYTGEKLEHIVDYCTGTRRGRGPFQVALAAIQEKARLPYTYLPRGMWHYDDRAEKIGDKLVYDSFDAVSLCVNGNTTRFKRGETVKLAEAQTIPEGVASVIHNRLRAFDPNLQEVSFPENTAVLFNNQSLHRSPRQLCKKGEPSPVYFQTIFKVIED